MYALIYFNVLCSERRQSFFPDTVSYFPGVRIDTISGDKLLNFFSVSLCFYGEIIN